MKRQRRIKSPRPTQSQFSFDGAPYQGTWSKRPKRQGRPNTKRISGIKRGKAGGRR
jgi:hypothetical protein